MALSDDIRTRAARYVAGLDTLQDFEGWLGPVLADVDPDADAEGNDLAMAVAGYLSELGDGVRSEAEVKAALRPLIEVRLLDFGTPPWRITGSTLTTTRSVRL